jgi:sulfate transport system permease protein
MLYNEYSFTAAFAAASLLTLAAIVTIVLKKVIEVTSGVDPHIEEREVKS